MMKKYKKYKIKKKIKSKIRSAQMSARSGLVGKNSPGPIWANFLRGPEKCQKPMSAYFSGPYSPALGQ